MQARTYSLAHSTLHPCHTHALQLATDSQGDYFLDRDPEYFRHVLGFLRNGGVLPADLPERHTPEYARLRQEFDYFLLSDVAFPRVERSLVDHIASGDYYCAKLRAAEPTEPRRACA